MKQEPQKDAHILRLGHVLHDCLDATVTDPLPTRWVDLILALNERERIEVTARTKVRRS
jgi:hypothetical protein